jgi:hypothetical protein
MGPPDPPIAPRARRRNGIGDCPLSALGLVSRRAKGRNRRAGMTALSEYQRLEASGVWRAAPGAQRRDVIVALGEATLVLSDMQGRALAHWSLAAVERRNPGVAPALYAPGDDAVEELELADGEMIAAVERVRRAVERARPAPGPVRTRLALGSVAARSSSSRSSGCPTR